MAMRVLMLLDNPATNDSRVQRESETLAAAGHETTLVCTASANSPKEETRNGVLIRRSIDPLRVFDIKDARYGKELAASLASEYRPDVLHTHDREMLRVARHFLRCQPDPMFIHDVHEMHFSFPLISHGKSWSIRLKSWATHRIRVAREARDMKIVRRFITVNSSIEKALRARFRLPRPGVVLRNVPALVPLPPRSRILHEKLGIPSGQKILVFIGANVYPKVLNLEQVVLEMASVPDVALVFICGDNANKRELERWISGQGVKNCFFHGLVPPEQIPAYLAGCDAGLVPTWNKKNLSYWLALDNKLFDYVMAGIPVLATAQPEYRAVVEAYHLGVCVNPDEPGAYRSGLSQIRAQPEAYQPDLQKARLELNWNQESRKLLDLYGEVMTKNARPLLERKTDS